jgi:hypothetical protein
MAIEACATTSAMVSTAVTTRAMVSHAVTASPARSVSSSRAKAPSTIAHLPISTISTAHTITAAGHEQMNSPLPTKTLVFDAKHA